MTKCKIYYPKEHYEPGFRAQVFPLLKPFLKNKGFSDEERIRFYGISLQDVVLLDEPDNADIFILPMSWNYYVENGKKQVILDLIKSFSDTDKKLWIYNAGDFGYKIPYFSNTVIFRSAVYRNKKRSNEHILPPFIPDPLESVYNADKPYLKTYSKVPTVGFCGQARASVVSAAFDLARIGLQNLSFFMRCRKAEPQRLISSSFLRSQILSKLEKVPQINTNFILRKKYRAGVKTEKEKLFTSLEFYNNIKDSDYVLCVRGAGNFSVRFYETLAMGRIPVYVSSEGVLPLEHHINWNKHLVWIGEGETAKIGNKVLAFHDNLNSDNYQDLLKSNRKLWEDSLKLGSYFKIILDLIKSRDGKEK